ncbi:hypothetical protein AB8I91_002917 [Clostridium perfringens]
MSILRELEKRIENANGIEQELWVHRYEEYLSAKIKIDVIRKSSKENPMCYSENGEIKYKYFSEEEKEKIIRDLEEVKLEIEQILK